MRGAEPGDALQVRIVEVALADDWGFNWIKSGKGALPEDFPMSGSSISASIVKQAIVRTPWGHEIPARPFLA